MRHRLVINGVAFRKDSYLCRTYLSLEHKLPDGYKGHGFSYKIPRIAALSGFPEFI